MRNRESIPRTLLVAGGVAAFCSLTVSSAVYWLRPFELAYRSIEDNRALVAAAGLADAGQTLSDDEVVEHYVRFEILAVDIATGRYSRVHGTVPDYRAALQDSERSAELDAAVDEAGLGRRPLEMPVYVLRDGARLERVVLPVFGRGMWSTIHGFVALGPDLETVAGVRFHDHGETPGIGDRIEDAAWLASFAGKRAYDDAGEVALRIGGTAGDRASSVDAITGATVTVSAVERLVRFWLGPAGYGPFLAALRAEEP